MSDFVRVTRAEGLALDTGHAAWTATDRGEAPLSSRGPTGLATATG